MSPAGAIGVNVALSTAAVAAQEIYPRLGRGTIPRDALANVQRIREPDVRNLHSLQRGVGRVLQGAGTARIDPPLGRADHGADRRPHLHHAAPAATPVLRSPVAAPRPRLRLPLRSGVTGGDDRVETATGIRVEVARARPSGSLDERLEPRGAATSPLFGDAIERPPRILERFRLELEQVFASLAHAPHEAGVLVVLKMFRDSPGA